MPSKFTKLVCAAALAGSFFFAGCATRPVVNGVPNFAEVSAGIYRGGQPNEQGWQFLRSLGVTNVVKLNREVTDTPADGMIVHSIPLPPATIWEMFQKPCSNDVWRAVQAMNHRGTYVHCNHGRDRVGMVAACYRMWIEGWSESAAAREMGAMGYRWYIPGLTSFWKSVTATKKDRAMTKDPICGMTVDEATALHAERNGKTYYFCCDGCRQKFLSTPAGAKPEGKSGGCCG